MKSFWCLHKFCEPDPVGQHHLTASMERACVCAGVRVCVALRAMNPKHQHQRGKMLNNDKALIAV